jgi:hypothetical protein
LSTAPKESERKPSNGEVVHQKPIKNSVNFSDMMPSTSSSKSTTQGSQTSTDYVRVAVLGYYYRLQTLKRNNYWGDAREVVLSREPNETFGMPAFVLKWPFL